MSKYNVSPNVIGKSPTPVYRSISSNMSGIRDNSGSARRPNRATSTTAIKRRGR